MCTCICLCMSACNSARMCKTNMQFPAQLNPRLSAIWCLPCLRMEALTGLEWNSEHFFEGIIGTIFFNSAGMQTLHLGRSGMLQYPAVFDSICSLFSWACWCLLGPAPVLAPGQQVGVITEAWLRCALCQAFESGRVALYTHGPWCDSQSEAWVQFPNELKRWMIWPCSSCPAHSFHCCFLSLDHLSKWVSRIACLMVKCPGMPINYSWYWLKPSFVS